MSESPHPAPEPAVAPRGNREWQVYRRLLAFAFPYRLRLMAGFALGLLYGAANGALVWFVQKGLKTVFDQGEVTRTMLALIVLGLPLVALIRGSSDFGSSYYIQWVGNRVVMDIRNRMFGHLHQLSVSYFSGSRTGELISRTTNDTVLIEKAVSSVISDLAKQPLTLMIMVITLFCIDTKLALISLIGFPICIIPIGAFGRRVRRYSRQAQERVADFVSILQESVAGVRIVKAFGMEGYEVGRFVRQTGEFFSRIMRVTRATLIVEPIIVFISFVGVSLILLYVRFSGMPSHQLFTFITAMVMMYEPVKKISRIYVTVQQSTAAADRIFEVLDTPASVSNRPTAMAFEGALRGIEFCDVSFAYGDTVVLKGVSLKVKAGERVAFVGGSGAGKTTLVNLLPRFYDVTGGQVLINGIDVRDLTLRSLRKRIGLVSQDTFLFNDTVAHNIRYGTDEATDIQVVEAAKQAYADDFISTMNQGYQTLIGERGVRLSGGQCQRLAIARAVLRNPPILILDEATSALDTESERMVQSALDGLMAGRTVLAIAHRLSTVVNYDRIIVLEDGRIVEQGRHEELLKLNGIYKRLHDLQFQPPSTHS